MFPSRALLKVPLTWPKTFLTLPNWFRVPFMAIGHDAIEERNVDLPTPTFAQAPYELL